MTPPCAWRKALVGYYEPIRYGPGDGRWAVAQSEWGLLPDRISLCSSLKLKALTNYL